jgi:transcriptional regulator with XRE-family HTH domain
MIDDLASMMDCGHSEAVAKTVDRGQSADGMLSGNQIAAARRLAGIGSQEDLANLAGVSRPTVERAEGAREAMPLMRTDQLVRIVRALEGAGVEFFLSPGASLAGGLGMRIKKR